MRGEGGGGGSVWEALEIWTMEMGYSVKCKNYGDRKNGKTGATKYEFANIFELDQEKVHAF